jgi:hypothetical protein
MEEMLDLLLVELLVWCWLGCGCWDIVNGGITDFVKKKLPPIKQWQRHQLEIDDPGMDENPEDGGRLMLRRGNDKEQGDSSTGTGLMISLVGRANLPIETRWM